MKEGTLYRHIIKDAWNVAWKSKTLWVLGFLAVFWGDVGAYQSFNKALDKISPVLPDAYSLSSVRLFAESLSPWTFSLMMALILILLAILVAFVMLVTSGRGGLIYAIEKRNKEGKVTIKKALQKGLKHFWSLFGIGVITRVDLLLYALLFSFIPSAGAGIEVITFFTLSFVIVTFVSIVLSFLGVYASAFVVLEDRSFGKAILGSIQMFAEHWLVTVELGLILYFITLFIGLGSLIVLFVLTIPFIMLAFIASALNATYMVGLIWIIASIIYIVALLIIGSAFITFQYSTWVILYVKLRNEGAISKVIRATSKFSRVLHKRIV